MKKIIIMIKKYIQTPGSYSIRQLRRKRRQKRAHRVSAPNPNEDQDCLLQQWGWRRSKQRFLGSAQDRQRGNRRQRPHEPRGSSQGGCLCLWARVHAGPQCSHPRRDGGAGACLAGTRNPLLEGMCQGNPLHSHRNSKRLLRLSVSCRSAQPLPRCFPSQRGDLPAALMLPLPTGEARHSQGALPLNELASSIPEASYRKLHERLVCTNSSLLC